MAQRSMTVEELQSLARQLGLELQFTNGTGKAPGTAELEPRKGESSPQGTFERSQRGYALLQETLEKFQKVVEAIETSTQGNWISDFTSDPPLYR